MSSVRRVYSRITALTILGFLFVSSYATAAPQEIPEFLSDVSDFVADRNSLNWSGYVVATSFSNPQARVTGISASWEVPEFEDEDDASTSSNSFSLVWIGIGGFFTQGCASKKAPCDRSLIQVGTGHFEIRGAKVHFAWFELLPAPPCILGTSCAPGAYVVDEEDKIDASITLKPSGKWSMTLSNEDKEWTFSKEVTYPSSKLSAEWIVERPLVRDAGCRCFVLPQLADFDEISFRSASVTVGGVTSSIGNAPWFDRIILVENPSLQPLVDVSELKKKGTRFSVEREESDSLG